MPRPPHRPLSPLLNLVSIALPLLVVLGAVVHAGLRVMEEPLPPPTPRDSLQLTVRVDHRGFIIASRHGVLRPEQVAAVGASVPCHGPPCRELSDYDFEALAELLELLHEELPGEDELTISPAGSVPYRVILEIMDLAQRPVGPEEPEPLFPVVSVSRGTL